VKQQHNILFSHSYFMQFDPKQWSIGRPYPPLGTITAAALLRQYGYQVSLFDTMFLNNPDEVLKAIEVDKPRYFVVYDDGFNYLTKMCLTNMRQAAFKMCKLAKQQGCTVIVSSSDSTDHYKQYLEEGADYVIIGEAEHTLLELIDNLSYGKGEVKSIPGLAYASDGGFIKTHPRPVLKDLDSLPLPAWDLIDMQQYKQTWMKSSGYFSLNMSTTRGCPFKCNWCAKPIYGNRYNLRSVGHVIEELKLLINEYGAEHIWFSDDIFGLRYGWVSEFAERVTAEGLKFRFKIQSRADLLLLDHQIAALAKAGCENVWIGAESGSQKVLDAMDKGTGIGQIHQSTQLMKKHGIRPSFFIQFGYPGETKEDIALTIAMINKLLPFEIGISVSYPLPGTGFYERIKADLKTKSNWTDSDEMALMFTNTFPPSYYKQLHKYVHSNYHQHLARNSFKQLISAPLKTNFKGFKKALSVLYYVPATLVEKYRLKQTEQAW
jgi:anaerobic magnesium-protoporphyrin IX monomethyl ester cyclase